MIKHSGHLRTLDKCRKHSPAGCVFYISLVFSNYHRVLTQCNTRLMRLLTLPSSILLSSSLSLLLLFLLLLFFWNLGVDRLIFKINKVLKLRLVAETQFQRFNLWIKTSRSFNVNNGIPSYFIFGLLKLFDLTCVLSNSI